MDVLPAQAADVLAAIAADTMAHHANASKALDVETEELALVLAFVAPHRRGGGHGGQAPQSAPA